MNEWAHEQMRRRAEQQMTLCCDQTRRQQKAVPTDKHQAKFVQSSRSATSTATPTATETETLMTPTLNCQLFSAMRPFWRSVHGREGGLR